MADDEQSIEKPGEPGPAPADDASPVPDDTAMDPWIGQLLAGYYIIRRIGEGGMGIVYLARHQSLNRLAAVKFLGAHMVTDKAYIERFLHEARGAAKLSHPNIVSVFDAGSMGSDIFFFIMEFVEGKDLGSLLRELHILPVSQAIDYVRQATEALAYAHGKQIIHRDIKPDNLMLTGDGVIKVGDLGLAKWIEDDASGGMTQTGVVMGTPFYISPEQVRGARDIDLRADVYSLGATLFHLVTGKIPYEGTSPAVIMAMHLNNPVPEPSKINPGLDRDICAIIKKMMAKKPDERYQTMEEVNAVLAEYQARGSHTPQIVGQASHAAAQGAIPAAAASLLQPLGMEFESEADDSTKIRAMIAASIIIAAIFFGLFVTSISKPRPPEQKTVQAPPPEEPPAQNSPEPKEEPAKAAPAPAEEENPPPAEPGGFTQDQGEKPESR